MGGRGAEAALADQAARGTAHLRKHDDRRGRNAKVLSTYMGHSSITITLDRYGHLMPGNESESAGLLDAYLQRTGAHTGAQ
jgi:integrase